MSLSLHENNMPKISHYKTFYFLQYVNVSYVKCLFRNIQKTIEYGNVHVSRINNTIILWIKNAKFSGYSFYMNTKI